MKIFVLIHKKTGKLVGITAGEVLAQVCKRNITECNVYEMEMKTQGVNTNTWAKVIKSKK